MRQAFRRYAFPMIIIAAVLAAALPLTCFAAEPVYITNEFASTILGIRDFPYITLPSLNASSVGNSMSLLLRSYYSSSNFSVLCRQETFPFVIAEDLKFSLPFFLNDISSFNLSLFIGIVNFDSPYNSKPNYNDSLSISSALLTTDFESIDLDISTIGDIQFSYGDESSGFNYFFLRKYIFSFSSSSFFDINTFELFGSLINSSDLPPNFSVIFGISEESSLTTVTGGSASVIKSLEIMARLFDSFIDSELHTDSQILDKLDDILDYFSSNGSSGGESEDILADGEEKQQELEQLGDALSNVPKPSIENITQSFDPADTMISADPGMVQTALSIVYSWDKFLILLGLFIAVGTISYIIFGKKS